MTAYRAAVDAWIEEHRDRLVADLAEAASIPSIASRPDQVERFARWLAGRLADVLDEVRLHPVDGAGPLVVGQVAGGTEKRLLLYSHYDVQPADDGWDHDPFDPVVADGRIVARGVADDKADILARLHALEALRDLGIPLPVSLVWLSEGAEEVGSPGLGAAVAELRDELRSDGCLWESYLRDTDGRPEIGFGARGLVALELRLRLLAGDQHSAFSGVVRSAPTELAHALASMVDVDGRVLVAGLDTASSDLDPDAHRHALGIPLPDVSSAALPGVRTLVNRPGHELGPRTALEPTLNIATLTAGHQGEGVLTIVPASARARVDVRTLPGQDADWVAGRIRAHLDAHGWTDVEIDVLHAVPASAGPLTGPFADAVIAASTARFGEPIIHPLVAGAGPMHEVADILGVAIVAPPGSTRMASSIHGPHENVSVADYLQHVGFVADLIAELGRRWEE